MEEKIMTMNDNELEMVNGGAASGGKSAANTEERTTEANCPFCGKKTTFIVYSGGRGKCKICNNVSPI